MPSARARSRVRASISASVVRPYNSGSRSPSRFRLGPFSTAICTSAVPTCRRPTTGPGTVARPVGTPLGLEAPEPGLELIEVGLVFNRRSGRVARRTGRRQRHVGTAGTGASRTVRPRLGRVEELVEREAAALLRGGWRRAGSGLGARRIHRCRDRRRQRSPRPLVAEDLVERDAVGGGARSLTRRGNDGLLPALVLPVRPASPPSPDQSTPKRVLQRWASRGRRRRRSVRRSRYGAPRENPLEKCRHRFARWCTPPPSPSPPSFGPLAPPQRVDPCAQPWIPRSLRQQRLIHA